MYQEYRQDCHSRDVEADWHETRPQTIAGFSAVAYYFGRKLYKNLNVPIGLINTSWGGTRIEPWTPPVGLATVPALATISKEVQDVQANYRAQLPQKMKDIEAWIAETREALESNAPLKPMPDNMHPIKASRQTNRTLQRHGTPDYPLRDTRRTLVSG